MMYAGDEYYSDDITSGDGGDEQDDHIGCICGLCRKIIDVDDEGMSSPFGSVHVECGEQHEAANPDQW